jgi:hypothetical protein
MLVSGQIIINCVFLALNGWFMRALFGSLAVFGGRRYG